MDDIWKKADDKAWDAKQDRWISDLNRKIEEGLEGEALATLHGSRVPVHDEAPCDVDENSEVDDQETLSNKIIGRLIQIGETISRNRDLPDDVKQRWTAMLQECHPGEPKTLDVLRDLRRQVVGWDEIDPESYLSLVHGAIGAVATVIEIYLRRFCS